MTEKERTPGASGDPQWDEKLARTEENLGELADKLDAPPPIPDAPVTPVETFADSVLVAYKTVLDDG